MNTRILQVCKRGYLVFLPVAFAVESSAARMMPGMKSVLNKSLRMTLPFYNVEERKTLPTLGEVGDWLGVEGKKYFHLQSTMRAQTEVT